METESEDFTPPSSPILGYSGLKDHHALAESGLIFCLSCKGEPRIHSQDHSFSPNGYILRRQVLTALDSLTHLNNSFNETTRKKKLRLYNIFGRMWDPIDFHQLKTLTLICRKHIASLEILCDPVYSYNIVGSFTTNPIETDDDDLLSHAADPWKLRKQVCLFLNIVLSQVNYYQRKFSGQQLEVLFGGLKRSLGRVDGWSSSLKAHCGYKDGNECTSALYHGFHLNLELRWSLLILNSADSSTLSWIFQDLIHLAWLKFTREGDFSLLEKQPFNCWCVKEIWTMIRLLIYELEKPFWEIFEEEMKKFILGESSRKDIFFIIWLTLHIASLSDYNTSGVYVAGRERSESSCNDGSSNNGYKFFNSVLKEWSSRGGKTIEINKLCQKLLSYWGFDLEVVVLFWNHWIPKIDKFLEAKSLDQYGSVERWLKLVELLSTEGEGTSGGEELEKLVRDDSFLSFLRLLISHAALINVNSREWKKLKSHIGMKLNKTNVGGFSEIGIVRVSTLYMALANVTNDIPAMCERLKEILEYGKSSPGRKKTILRALATTIIICLKKNQDIRLLPLTKSFMDTINDLLSQASLDPLKKDMVMIYLDLLDTLPSTPHFNTITTSLGRESLLSPNLTMWLSSCGPNYVVRTLRVLNKLTTWILSSKRALLHSPSFSEGEKEDLANKISERTIQFLMQEAILNSNRVPSTDIEPMAFLAADLTLLCLKGGGRGDLAFSNYFNHFTMNERTCPQISELYLQKLFSFPEERIEGTFSDVKWGQVWIRLNALGFSLPDALNNRVLGDSFASTSNQDLLQRLCYSTEELSRGDVQNILSPLVTLVKCGVGGVYKDSQIVNSIVQACGCVFKYIKFDKVYIKGDSTSFAHKVFEMLIPPFVGVPPWEKLPTQVVSALKHELFHMFGGIVSYLSTTSDPYLTRKLQDIFVFAFLGYIGPQEEEETPAMEMLTYAEDKSIDSILTHGIGQVCKMPKDAKLTQRFVLAVTGLKNKGMATTVIRFLSSILSIYISQNGNSEISNACANIVIYCSAFGLTPFKVKILAAFETVMEKDFAFKSKRFFDLSSFLSKSSRPQVKRFLRLSLLPMYKGYVMASEQRRASGLDNSLRLPLEKLERETRGFENA